jgi:hypothetical protein
MKKKCLLCRQKSFCLTGGLNLKYKIMYDIVIPAHEKDFVKIRFAYDSFKHLKGFKDIYCISNVKMPDKLRIKGVKYYTDDEVIDFDFGLFTGVIRQRTGWYRQMFVKFFQNVSGDEYLITEADNIYNRDIEIYENDKPVFILGQDQNHKPYFDFSQKLFGFGREYPYSFINEVMLIEREIIRNFVHSTCLTSQGFFELIAAELNRTQEVSGMADYELYGNYVTKYFPDMYLYKHYKSHVQAKQRMWTEEEISKHIKMLEKKDIDLIKIHSWL